MIDHLTGAYIRLGREGAIARPSLARRLLGALGLRYVGRRAISDNCVLNSENRYGVPDAD